jgi:hypothetical protein
MNVCRIVHVGAYLLDILTPTQMLTSAIATWYMHQIIADQIYSLSTHLKKSACNKFKSVYIIITFSPIILSIRYRLPAYNSHTPTLQQGL